MLSIEVTLIVLCLSVVPLWLIVLVLMCCVALAVEMYRVLAFVVSRCVAELSLPLLSVTWVVVDNLATKDARLEQYVENTLHVVVRPNRSGHVDSIVPGTARRAISLYFQISYTIKFMMAYKYLVFILTLIPEFVVDFICKNGQLRFYFVWVCIFFVKSWYSIKEYYLFQCVMSLEGSFYSFEDVLRRGTSELFVDFSIVQDIILCFKICDVH